MVSGGSVYIIELERRRRAASDMLPVGTVRGIRREGILNSCGGRGAESLLCSKETWTPGGRSVLRR